MKSLNFRKTFLSVTMVGFLCLSLNACRGKPQPGAISSAQAIEHINVIADKLTIIDVRSPQEFEQGHIPQARNIPLDTLEEQLNTIPKTPILIVCRSGNRAEKAYHFIMKKQPWRKNLRYLQGTPKYNPDGTYTLE